MMLKWGNTQTHLCNERRSGNWGHGLDVQTIKKSLLATIARRFLYMITNHCINVYFIQL